jgi:hypothetical protein
MIGKNPIAIGHYHALVIRKYNNDWQKPLLGDARAKALAWGCKMLPPQHLVHSFESFCFIYRIRAVKERETLLVFSLSGFYMPTCVLELFFLIILKKMQN